LMFQKELISAEQAQKLFEVRDQVLLSCEDCKTLYRIAKYKLRTTLSCKRCKKALPLPENLPELNENDLDFSRFDSEEYHFLQGIFIILAGTHVGEIFRVKEDESLSIGRADEMNLRLFDGAISRRQCLISCKNREYFIQDTHSSGGTFVNGILLQSKQKLKFGDLIKAGHTVIEFRPENPADKLRTSSASFHLNEVEDEMMETQEIQFPSTSRTPIPIASASSKSLNPVISSLVKNLNATLPSSKSSSARALPTNSESPVSSGEKEEESKKTIIYGYDILEKLGAGKMGVVYRALRKENQSVVALKIMKPPKQRSDERIKRFIQEARLINELDHPHIIKGYDVGVSEPYYFIAMELFEGYPLNEIFSQFGVFSERRAVLVLLHITRALSCLEKRNLLHRDIKPSNILMNKERTIAKLCDMGLAKMLDQDYLLTKVGCAVGTPFYNSPETVQGFPDIDIRSDLYSLGATLFHLVTGRVPFEGQTVVDISIKHVREPLPDIAPLAPQVSKRFIKILNKMMAKKREERFLNTEELLETLKLCYRF
jgi:pSer/pThr/pTyr-binding forkhead associated (FHA) protein/tRNA A-37 threonylcarbamoyl transferase component Bud32